MNRARLCLRTFLRACKARSQRFCLLSLLVIAVLSIAFAVKCSLLLFVSIPQEYLSCWALACDSDSFRDGYRHSNGSISSLEFLGDIYWALRNSTESALGTTPWQIPVIFYKRIMSASCILFGETDWSANYHWSAFSNWRAPDRFAFLIRGMRTAKYPRLHPESEQPNSERKFARITCIALPKIIASEQRVC